MPWWECESLQSISTFAAQNENTKIASRQMGVRIFLNLPGRNGASYLTFQPEIPVFPLLKW